MPCAARLGDSCTGHGCWPSRTNNQASSNVFINGRGTHRLGDTWNAHTCPSIPETHASTQASGSSSVFVNGKALARIGDGVACGSFVATGSNNVVVDTLAAWIFEKQTVKQYITENRYYNINNSDFRLANCV